MDHPACGRTQFSRFRTDSSQRTTALMPLPSVLQDRGASLDDLERIIPIPKTVWKDPGQTLPFSQVCAILEAAARITDCPHLGLLLGARVEASQLGLPGAWLASAPTLRAALEGYIALQQTNTRAASLYLVQNGSDAFFGYGSHDRAAQGLDQVYLLVTAIATATVRRLTRQRFAPLEVHFPFRAKGPAHAYAQLLGAEVRFNATECGIVLPAVALDHPTGQRPDATFDHWLAEAPVIGVPQDRVWTQRTRHALRHLIPRKRALRSDVARALGTTHRTLVRRLEAEGTSLRALTDEMRFIVSEELLLLTDLPTGEVALATGYETASSFFRSFRRWTGTTPELWRTCPELRETPQDRGGGG